MRARVLSTVHLFFRDRKNRNDELASDTAKKGKETKNTPAILSQT
jgi:hypothetical protein